MVEILDGAVGTELVSRGLELDAPAWSARAITEAPELLSEIHRDYAHAGARLHTANTFRTQPGTLGAGWQDALSRAVRLARDSIPESCTLLGSIAPVADCYRPDLSPGAEARSTHREVARALVAAGCDVLLCETFAAQEEAIAAAEEAVSTGIPAWLSLTPGPFGTLLSPSALSAVASRAVDTGIERLLVNCVAASLAQPYVEAIAGLGLPIGVYANAGLEEEGLGWGRTDEKAVAAYAALACRWVDVGATVVGGCCGTTPLHVEALAARFG